MLAAIAAPAPAPTPAAAPAPAPAAPKITTPLALGYRPTEAKMVATPEQAKGWALADNLAELDTLGPFYSRAFSESQDVRTNPALDGQQLIGRVLDARSGNPINNARVQAWVVNPDENYRIASGRSEQFSAADGSYKVHTDTPIGYLGRPAHVHLLGEAPGYHAWVGQQYPSEEGAPVIPMDVVLEPVLPGQEPRVKTLGTTWLPGSKPRDGKPDGFVGAWNGPELNGVDARTPFVPKPA